MNVSLYVYTKYYWRVCAISGAVAGPWATDSFTTIPFPAAPALQNPQHNAANVSPNAYFQWDTVATATGYHVRRFRQRPLSIPWSSTAPWYGMP